MKGDNDIMNTIVVRGTGRATSPVDEIRVDIILNSTDYEYQSLAKDAARKLQELRNCLSEVGFTKENIKATGLNVQTINSSKNINGIYKTVFEGYLYRQNLYIVFAMNNETLKKVLSALGNCDAKPEYSLKFQLKDEKEFKDKLLANAVIDARNKAIVMANAAGVKLGKVVNIDYNEPKVIPFMRSNIKMYDSAMDVVVDDITEVDNVVVTYEIL